jgi:hypothetical protein
MYSSAESVDSLSEQNYLLLVKVGETIQERSSGVGDVADLLWFE